MKKFDKHGPENQRREKYWNEDYVAYWKARVAEANTSRAAISQMVAGDAKTSTDNVYIDSIGLLGVNRADSVLELACGFGRSLPMLCEAARHVAAVDISEQMIAVAKGACQARNVSFHVSASEDLPFPDASFDVVICFAAFDAMYQTEALIEIARVSRQGGHVLITGKNDNYHDDDEAALAAEIGARGKNHPNYFTDVEKLADNLDRFGFSIEVQRYHQRRGDFGQKAPSERRPDRFYEYLFVLKKVGECTATPDLRISADVSKTFQRRAAPVR